jgi:ribosome-binding protein aMBF1 (putative translation factor)
VTGWAVMAGEAAGGAWMSPEACRRERQQRGWSPWTLARAAGTAEGVILAFEAGVGSPRPGALTALRRALQQEDRLAEEAAL